MGQSILCSPSVWGWGGPKRRLTHEEQPLKTIFSTCLFGGWKEPQGSGPGEERIILRQFGAILGIGKHTHFSFLKSCPFKSIKWAFVANLLRASSRRGERLLTVKPLLLVAHCQVTAMDGPTAEHGPRYVHLYNQGASRNQGVHCKQRRIDKDHPPTPLWELQVLGLILSLLYESTSKERLCVDVQDVFCWKQFEGYLNSWDGGWGGCQQHRFAGPTWEIQLGVSGHRAQASHFLKDFIFK